MERPSHHRPARTQADANERRARLLDATGVLGGELLRGRTDDFAAALSLRTPDSMLDSRSRAFLVAVDRLTRDSYGTADGSAIRAELQQMGQETDAVVLYNLVRRLKDEGYVNATIAGGMDFDASGLISLTPQGREQAHDPDPFERYMARRAASLDQPRLQRLIPVPSRPGPPLSGCCGKTIRRI